MSIVMLFYKVGKPYEIDSTAVENNVIFWIIPLQTFKRLNELIIEDVH